MTVSWVFTPEQEPFTNRIARRINWRFNDAVMDEDKTLCAGVQQRARRAHLRARRAQPQRARDRALPRPAARDGAGHRRRVSGSRRDRLDAWLFLPPELERDGPGAARPARRPGRAGAHAARRASARSRSSCSRARPSAGAATCARAETQVGAALAGEPPPAVRAAALRLAAMLLEQQLLAPGVPRLQLADDAERARLEALLRAHGVGIDDV